MDKSHQVSGDEHLTLEEAEVSMETHMIQEAAQKASRTTSNADCTHQRLIDDVLSRGGKRTGKVRCLECGTIFDDPYQGSR
jgi:rubrerythrin